MAQPVIKSFVTLAITMLLLVLAPLVYDRVPIAFAWGVSTTVGSITVVLLIESGLQVRREMKEFTETASESPA